MANTYMYLGNKRTGERIYIAKYYPSTGWCVQGNVHGLLVEGFADADFGHLTDEQKDAKSRQIRFGPPYSAAGQDGEEWEVQYG